MVGAKISQVGASNTLYFHIVSACPDTIDILFALDASGSIGADIWQAVVVPFVNAFALSWPISDSQSHIGISQFANESAPVYTYADTQTNEAVETMILIDMMNSYVGGYTNTSGGLFHLRSIYDQVRRNDWLIKQCRAGSTSDVRSWRLQTSDYDV